MRKQRVAIDGTTSGWVSVKSDVPQGTMVLGPLMLFIYINDIGEDVLSVLKLLRTYTEQFHLQ